MFHFNTVTRTTFYAHDFNAAGIDHCFDCVSEVTILDRYLQQYKGIEDAQERKRQVQLMSEVLSEQISTSGRTLVVA